MSHNSSQKGMKIYHPPLIPPIKGGKVPSPLVGEGLGEGYFRINTTKVAERKPILLSFLPKGEIYKPCNFVTVQLTAER